MSVIDFSQNPHTKSQEIQLTEFQTKYITPTKDRLKNIESQISEFTSQQKFFESRGTMQNERIFFR